uniref:Angiomotin_C domain-containing protein n=1 Tax=Echinostoma caproni TaxID=27848 RepID=A0A183B763_9TREM
LSIHLPRMMNTSNLKLGAQKFFDPYVSPEQHLRLNQTTGTLSPISQTPQTVIRLPHGVTQSMLDDSMVDHLREENKQLLSRLTQMRHCVQKAIEQKQEAELELTRLQSQSVCLGAAGDQSRMSEGLQSFLEHESRLQHMETMEQLRQQIYELEEQFATKHDTLIRTETAYQQVQAENAELSQRVVSFLLSLHRLPLLLRPPCFVVY